MQVLPAQLINFATEEFQRLFMAYGGDQDLTLAEFHTDSFHCGHIVFLEHGDNVDDLSALGIPGALRCSMAECVEFYQIDQLLFYRIIVLLNNDYALTFLFETGINQDALFEAWLMEERSEMIVLPATVTQSSMANIPPPKKKCSMSWGKTQENGISALKTLIS